MQNALWREIETFSKESSGQRGAYGWVPWFSSPNRDRMCPVHVMLCPLKKKKQKVPKLVIYQMGKKQKNPHL